MNYIVIREILVNNNYVINEFNKVLTENHKSEFWHSHVFCHPAFSDSS